MTIRIGILGFAHGHVGAYCAQWRRMPRDVVQVVTGWDHDAARLAENAKQFELAACHSSAALLARPDVDAEVIGAETAYHADLVEQAAGAGKAIVLQKPLALTLAEADRIVAAVDRARVPFTLAWQMRVDPQNLKMRELLHSGQLGRPLMVRRRHGLATHTWPGFAHSWHVKPELNRGMWADDACHATDWLYWMLGLPDSVMAEIATLLNPQVPDDHGVAVFRYDARRIISEIGCSFTCVAGENTTEITCENGVIIQNYGDAVSCGAARPAGAIGLKWFTRDVGWTDSRIPTPPDHGKRIAALAPELLMFLKGERPPICTAHEGRDSLRMTLACYRASELGQRVRIREL